MASATFLFASGLSNAFERARMAWDNLYFPQHKRSKAQTKEGPQKTSRNILWMKLPNHMTNIQITIVKPLAFHWFFKESYPNSTFLHVSPCQGASCALALCNWAAQLKKGDGLRSSLMRSHMRGCRYWCCQLRDLQQNTFTKPIVSCGASDFWCVD